VICSRRRTRALYAAKTRRAACGVALPEHKGAELLVSASPESPRANAHCFPSPARRPPRPHRSQFPERAVDDGRGCEAVRAAIPRSPKRSRERFRTQAGGEVGKIEQALAAGDADTSGAARPTASRVWRPTCPRMWHPNWLEKSKAWSAPNASPPSTPLVQHMRGEIDGVVAWIANNSGTAALKCA